MGMARTCAPPRAISSAGARPSAGHPQLQQSQDVTDAPAHTATCIPERYKRATGALRTAIPSANLRATLRRRQAGGRQASSGAPSAQHRPRGEQ